MAGHGPAPPGAHCSGASVGTARQKTQALAKEWGSAAPSWWYLSSRDKSRARNNNNENSDIPHVFLITFIWLKKVLHVGRPKGRRGQTAPLGPSLSPGWQLERKSHVAGKHSAHLPRLPKDQSAIPKLTAPTATNSPSFRGPQVSARSTGLGGLGKQALFIASCKPTSTVQPLISFIFTDLSQNLSRHFSTAWTSPGGWFRAEARLATGPVEHMDCNGSCNS